MSETASNTSRIDPGETVSIVKLRPDGSEAAEYDGVVVANHDSWIVAKAYWMFKRLDIGLLVFEPGDYLLEYFSTEEMFNALALFSSGDDFKGWYCNITHPTDIRDRRIYWHDLYVDVIQQPDGSITVEDEDELADSGLDRLNPQLHRKITATRDFVVAKMRTGAYPFSEVTVTGH